MTKASKVFLVVIGGWLSLCVALGIVSIVLQRRDAAAREARANSPAGREVRRQQVDRALAEARAERNAAHSIPRVASSVEVLARMEVAFAGYHSAAEIKRAMDAALRSCDLPVDAESYTRASSAVIALRQKTGVAEMEILRYVAASDLSGTGVSFPTAAATAATILAAKADGNP
jgi:hypothetical protein